MKENTAIQELVKELHKEGLRVFLSKAGTYGFFTNTEGNRVVSFGKNYFAIDFSGNYITDNPKQTGTCWRLNSENFSSYKDLLKCSAPPWALGAAKIIRYTTLEDKLKQYGKSSGYCEVIQEQE